MKPTDTGLRPSPAPRTVRERRRLAIALALARRAPSLARTLAELLATLGALAVVVLVTFVAPQKLSAALVAALFGGAALLGRRARDDARRSLAARLLRPGQPARSTSAADNSGTGWPNEDR